MYGHTSHDSVEYAEAPPVYNEVFDDSLDALRQARHRAPLQS